MERLTRLYSRVVRVWWVPAMMMIALLAACGGGSGGRLSASDYRAHLQTIAKESDTAQHAVEAGFQAKSVPGLVKVLTAFEATEKRIGNQVAALKPPQNAEAANTELAQGQHDTATELHAIIPKVEKMPSAKAAIAYLEKTPTSKGGREVDAALAKLKKLGYIKRTS
jgi:hypothetical protein